MGEMLNRTNARLDKVKELLQDEIARTSESIYQKIDNNDRVYMQQIDLIKDHGTKDRNNHQHAI